MLCAKFCPVSKEKIKPADPNSITSEGDLFWR